ncbi:trehalase isoform X1 [Spodoptera frugiperda]|uniref:Trehalase n=1 Tax=Spodoptera frugiperda TaxID=7108 RepID=A0A9R0E8U1_SPOFR|nr:trehalase isoform X1 [Spodoptera frugiperda]
MHIIIMLFTSVLQTAAWLVCFEDNKMQVFPFLLAAVVMLADSTDVLPSCRKRVYCNSKLLHLMEINRIYAGPREYINLRMNYDENKTLNDFEKLLNSSNNYLSKGQLIKFANKYFSNDSGVEPWVPPDFNTDPEFLNDIEDETLRDFARSIHNSWPRSGVKVKDDVVQNPDRYSLIPITHGFFVPGEQFQEMYYWDSNWIVKGLLISGMQETAKGVIENLFELVDKLGHVPAANRWYYENISQPPLLTEMVATYYSYTNDTAFLRKNIKYLEKEIDFWLKERSIYIRKDGKNYKVCRYFVPIAHPRPYAYYSDTEVTEDLSEQDGKEFLHSAWSTFESGWDFSSRWFEDPEDTSTATPRTGTRTMYVIPVDLNAIIANALQHIANFYTDLMNTQKAQAYAQSAQRMKATIQSVFWNEEDGIWYDYDLRKNTHRKYFYTSNFAPLWQSAVASDFVKAKGEMIIEYLKDSNALDYAGGVPNSMIDSGEVWDLPNVHPPSVSIMVNALESIGTDEAKNMAFNIAEKYIRACYVSFKKCKYMCHKYNVNRIGECGIGGISPTQVGFGWTSSLALELLMKYNKNINASDFIDQFANTESENFHCESPNNSVGIGFGVINCIITFMISLNNISN